MDTVIPSPAIVSTLMRREIERFVDAARVRAEYDVDTRRRAQRRYHRSWPLLVSCHRQQNELSAALHNASADGIGFLCDRGFPANAVVLIKLFWHEDDGLRVPAVVRHVTPFRHANLVGCHFHLSDDEVCRKAFESRRWYG